MTCFLLLESTFLLEQRLNQWMNGALEFTSAILEDVVYEEL